ncbi:MAG: 2-C-methyl-D-erythritol 4-phosphate cytidylyltransferase, partial [Solirubrobacterales bacterium]|nr:2-C-methyl-D-erythritol 4-phosphate cytidylyltransferase [Solirubrobacterales bacterium]
MRVHVRPRKGRGGRRGVPQRAPHRSLRRGSRLSARTCSAVIAAAGSGQRLGAGGPKALVELSGRPLIVWSLRALNAAESIGAIVIAAPPGYELAIEDAAGAAGVDVEVVSGGESRAESVRLALGAVSGEMVAIHDAARPLVSAELVDRVVSRLNADADADGVIAATPIVDTLKRAGEG